MTMAKKLPVLYPSIHTFEIHGTYYKYPIMVNLFERMKSLIKEGKYYPANKKKKQNNNNPNAEKFYRYTRKGGGLRVELGQHTGHGDWHITLSGINLARIAGNTSRLALVDRSPEGFDYQVQYFLMELEQLGFLEYGHEIEWILYRVDVTQDFYVKCDPVLPIKLVRYSGKAKPSGKGNANHYTKHNEMRSARYQKEEYDFEIYDKHKALLSDVEKGYPVPEEDLEQSKNLVRCEVQLKRKYLLMLEKRIFNYERWQLRALPMGWDCIFYILRDLWNRAPGILYYRMENLFGNDPWYYADVALKRVQESCLNDCAKKLVEQYIKTVNNEEKSTSYSAYQMSRIKKILKLLAINDVIIPDSILNAREYARLPYDPLCTKVQRSGKNL